MSFKGKKTEIMSEQNPKATGLPSIQKNNVKSASFDFKDTNPSIGVMQNKKKEQAIYAKDNNRQGKTQVLSLQTIVSSKHDLEKKIESKHKSRFLERAISNKEKQGSRKKTAVIIPELPLNQNKAASKANKRAEQNENFFGDKTQAINNNKTGYSKNQFQDMTMVMPLGELLKFAPADDVNESSNEVVHQFQDIQSDAGLKNWVFLSAKGGSGSSSFVVNIASYLQKRGLSCTIVDGDLQFGDIATLMSKENRTSIAKLLRDIDHGKPITKNKLSSTSEGVLFLSQVDYLDDLDEVDAGSINGLIRELSPYTDIVLFDGFKQFSDLCLASIDIADRIFIMCTFEITAVKRCQRFLAILDKIGFARAQICIIFNKYTEQAEVSPDSIRILFGDYEYKLCQEYSESDTNAKRVEKIWFHHDPGSQLMRTLYSIFNPYADLNDIQIDSVVKKDSFIKRMTQIFNKKSP